MVEFLNLYLKGPKFKKEKKKKAEKWNKNRKVSSIIVVLQKWLKHIFSNSPQLRKGKL